MLTRILTLSLFLILAFLCVGGIKAADTHCQRSADLAGLITDNRDRGIPEMAAVMKILILKEDGKINQTAADITIELIRRIYGSDSSREEIRLAALEACEQEE